MLTHVSNKKQLINSKFPPINLSMFTEKDGPSINNEERK